MNELQQRPTMEMSQNNSTGIAAIANTRELARIQGEILMAKMYPRDINRAISTIQADCQNFNLASKAIYQYAKGGTSIKGPSIRLAEVLARRLGNIRAGYEELDSDREKTTVRAYAYDIEANSQTERIFFVSHTRYTKNGSKLITDSTAVYEMVANQAQRRVRACILAQIPNDIVDYAIQTCEETMLKTINLDQKTKQDLLEAFKNYKVNQQMIEEKIQRNFDAITVNQVNDLRQIYTSIREGIGKPEEYFNFDLLEKKEFVPKVKPTADVIKTTKDTEKGTIGNNVAAQRIADLQKNTVKKDSVKPVKKDAIKNSQISKGFFQASAPMKDEDEDDLDSIQFEAPVYLDNEPETFDDFDN